MAKLFSNHNDYFSKIYAGGGWGPIQSGGGSSPENTVEYREFLSNFIKENKIKTVYDFGCGDWSFSKLIDWSNVKYTGIEIVESVVNNLKQYENANIRFVFLDDVERFYKCKGDLLIIKDVLQHWTNKEITTFLNNVKDQFKFILILNSSPQGEDWQETPERNRPLSCKYYPLKKYNIEFLKNYGEKELSIIKRENNIEQVKKSVVENKTTSTSNSSISAPKAPRKITTAATKIQTTPRKTSTFTSRTSKK